MYSCIITSLDIQKCLGSGKALSGMHVPILLENDEGCIMGIPSFVGLHPSMDTYEIYMTPIAKSVKSNFLFKRVSFVNKNDFSEYERLVYGL